MAMYLDDDLELLDDDFEFDGFGDTAGHAPRSNKHKYDTTSSAEYRNGKDMQGIPWERLDYSRDDYRGMRLKEYRNYESLSRSANKWRGKAHSMISASTQDLPSQQ